MTTIVGPAVGPPEDYAEFGFPASMSNLDFTIDDGTEERLRNERAWTRYAAINFNGIVWLNAEGSFSCQVWQWGAPVATFVANDLDALMHAVSDEYGYE